MINAKQKTVEAEPSRLPCLNDSSRLNVKMAKMIPIFTLTSDGRLGVLIKRNPCLIVIQMIASNKVKPTIPSSARVSPKTMWG